MPATLRLQEKYGDQLQVVLVESEGAPHDEMLRVALQRRWLDDRALWTTERVVRSSVTGTPRFVLLDAEGRRVLEGRAGETNSELRREVEEAVKGHVELARRARRKPRHGALPRVHEAIDELNYGDALRGLTLVDRDGHPADADARARLRAAIERDLARTTWLLDNGFPEEGVEWAAHLADELAGAAEWTTDLAGLAARADERETKDEIAAQKRLERLRRRLLKRGPDDVLALKLERIATDQAERGVGRRARTLVALARE